MLEPTANSWNKLQLSQRASYQTAIAVNVKKHWFFFSWSLITVILSPKFLEICTQFEMVEQRPREHFHTYHRTWYGAGREGSVGGLGWADSSWLPLPQLDTQEGPRLHIR